MIGGRYLVHWLIEGTISWKDSFGLMPISMRAHLRQAQNCILTLDTMIMCLFAAMKALIDSTVLGRSILFEPGSIDTIHFAMLATMGHDLIGVGTHEVAFETMEMWSFVGRRSISAWAPDMRALIVAAIYITPVLLELCSHQSVQPFMTGRVLDKARFITEGVATSLSHTVEMGLMLPISTVGIATIFVESVSRVPFGNWLIAQNAQIVTRCWAACFYPLDLVIRQVVWAGALPSFFLFYLNKLR